MSAARPPPFCGQISPAGGCPQKGAWRNSRKVPRALRLYRRRESRHIVARGNLDRTKRQHVRIGVLTIKQLKPPRAQAIHQGNQAHLARISSTLERSTEHALAKEHSTNRNAVQPAHQCVAQPRLHTVRMSVLMQVCIQLREIAGNPRAILN